MSLDDTSSPSSGPWPSSDWPPPEAPHASIAASPYGASTAQEGELAPLWPVRSRRHTVLFVLTILTTSYWGFIQYQAYYLDDLITLNPFSEPLLWLAGLPYGLAVVAFLLAHEMGHYLACRYYGIAATLPYFIPIPPVPGLVLLPGTMGAVIRIVAPIKSRRALFDVAIAGPLAGFAAALPILAVGLAQSRVVDLQDLGAGTISMGEPLIWAPLSILFAPPLGPAQTLLAHPLAFVGWFALLVTAMNLLPVGQLDGGHLLYAITPRLHRAISLLVVVAMVFAGFRYFSGWLVFAFLVLFVLGTHHPRPLSFEGTLGLTRSLLLVLAFLVFVSSFTLIPVTIDLSF